MSGKVGRTRPDHEQDKSICARQTKPKRKKKVRKKNNKSNIKEQPGPKEQHHEREQAQQRKQQKGNRRHRARPSRTSFSPARGYHLFARARDSVFSLASFSLCREKLLPPVFQSRRSFFRRRRRQSWKERITKRETFFLLDRERKNALTARKDDTLRFLVKEERIRKRQ